MKRNRRAQEMAAEGSHTDADILDIFQLQNGKCAYCRKFIKKYYEVDHITSLSKGGRNDRKNLQLLCKPCNASKNSADPVVYAQRLGLLI